MPIVALSCDPGIGYTSLCASILRLHTLASHILVHLPADDALISPSDPPQPLEMDAHNLLVKTAHMSTRILSCRVLDTGVAKDVSGVLRVTENNASIQVGFEEQEPTDEGNRGAELLYLVKGDGTVKIFERGAGGDA
jgi:elongator complex protein 6